MALDNSVQSRQVEGEDKENAVDEDCQTRVVPFFKSFSGSPSSRLSLYYIPSKPRVVQVKYRTFHSTQFQAEATSHVWYR